MIAKMKAHGFSCSFCGRSKDEVANIVTGTPQRAPGVPKRMIGKSAFICNECVVHYRQMVTGPGSLPTFRGVDHETGTK